MRNLKNTLLVVLALFLGTAANAEAAETSRQGSFWYIIDNISEVGEDAEAVIWVTLPPTWHGQEITLGDIVPEPVAILDDPASGNRIIEWRVQPEAVASDPLREVSQLFFHYDFEVRELAVRKHGVAAVGAYDRDEAQYLRYTKEEPGIQTDGRIRDLAREIAGSETEPYAIGRLLYGWILDNLEFKPNGVTDWDAMSIRDGRQGNCDQFSTLFVALCRSVGIPARTVANTYNWGGRHVFAEIIVPGQGWVPVDPTLGQMMTSGRGGLTESEVEAILSERLVPLGDAGWTYGNMFGNRTIICLGKNITFESPTLGRSITLQRMAPGGIEAHPAGFRLTGFTADIVHGGFYAFDQELTEESAHVLAHQRLAKYFFKADVNDFVEDICRQASSQYASGEQNWVNLGKSYMHKGEYYKAEAAFLRALRLNEAHTRENQGTIVWLHNYLGNCYDMLNQREMAIAQYEKALTFQNDFRGATKYANRYLENPFDME
ncbi:MAG: transglutaminase domain-containing protein [Candidatus Krumholzibacteria bacterium]|nr:transglutaminase domain-containing protein [Candidatus Krumholzibacteria bacterium]